MTSDLKDAVLGYSEDGLIVHLLSGKKPLAAQWQRSNRPMTTGQIEHWHAKADGVGLLLGRSNGIVCLDVDKKHGGLETWSRLLDAFGPVDTPADRTPGGGLHLFFRYREGVSTSRNLALGLELLSDRAQVAIPPTPGYERIVHGPLAEIPDWLLDNLAGPVSADTQGTNTATWRSGDLDPWDYVPAICGAPDSTGKFHCPAPEHPDHTPSLAIHNDQPSGSFCARPEQGGTHFHCHGCGVTGREQQLAALALGIYGERSKLGVPNSQRLDSADRARADEFLRELGLERV